MMEQLSGWLKEIVLIILFATFVDLLLPQRSLQRYVKVVVSLIVLLTILSPIIRFLRSDYTIDLKPLLGDSGRAGGAPAAGAWPTLDEIERQAEKLKQSDARQTERIVQSRLEQMIAQEVEQKFGVSVRSVTAEIAQDQDDKPSVTAVRIAIGPADDGSGDGSKQGSGDKGVSVAAIQPVEIDPIRIPDIAIGSDGEAGEEGKAGGAGNAGSAGGAGNGRSDPPPDAADSASAAPEKAGAASSRKEETLQAIALDIARTWNVKYDNVTVIDTETKPAS